MRRALRRAVRLLGAGGLTPGAFATALSVAAFVIVVVLCVEGAALWAIAGYLRLPTLPTGLLAVLLAVAGLWLSVQTVRLSLAAERGETSASD